MQVQGYRNEDRKLAAPRRRTFCKNRAFDLAIFEVTRERNPRPRDQAGPEEAQHSEAVEEDNARADVEARARAAALEALAEARQALEAAARAAAMGALADARSRALEAAARAAAMAVAERRIELPMAARAVATPAGAGEDQNQPIGAR